MASTGTGEMTRTSVLVATARLLNAPALQKSHESAAGPRATCRAQLARRPSSSTASALLVDHCDSLSSRIDWLSDASAAG